MTFQELILRGIPNELPTHPGMDGSLNHAPKRKQILSDAEKKLALKNALRYFPERFHQSLVTEFLEELETFGRIYMHRFRPTYQMYARPIHDYPGNCIEAKGIMLMIQNNLDPKVAQHPQIGRAHV